MDAAAFSGGDTDRTVRCFRFEIGSVESGGQKRDKDEQRVRTKGTTRVLSAKIIRFGFGFRLCDFCGV